MLRFYYLWCKSTLSLPKHQIFNNFLYLCLTLERNYKITNQNQLEEAFRMGDIINPGADEISVIFFDSANNIVNNKVFDKETSLEDIMIESYSPVARNFMLMNGKNATRRTLELGNDLNSLGFTEIDILTKEKGNTFYSK